MYRAFVQQGLKRRSRIPVIGEKQPLAAVTRSEDVLRRLTPVMLPHLHALSRMCGCYAQEIQHRPSARPGSTDPIRTTSDNDARDSNAWHEQVWFYPLQ